MKNGIEKRPSKDDLCKPAQNITKAGQTEVWQRNVVNE
jgi:hypothetical protein